MFSGRESPTGTTPLSPPKRVDGEPSKKEEARVRLTPLRRHQDKMYLLTKQRTKPGKDHSDVMNVCSEQTCIQK